MGLEIERKFLVDASKWTGLKKPEGQHYRQGYILTDPEKTIRVRVTDKQGYLTIKGISIGATRLEYEYEIPRAEAIELLDQFTVSELSKLRYKISFAGKIWEIDVFTGKNDGLIVAEIELSNENEQFELPEWIDREVTGEEQYYNANLTLHPFSDWQLPGV